MSGEAGCAGMDRTLGFCLFGESSMKVSTAYV